MSNNKPTATAKAMPMTNAETNAEQVLTRLQQVIEQRLHQNDGNSYVASLQKKGLDAICKKIAEEACEVVLAAKDGDQQHLIAEMADLWFHSLVLLSHQGVSLVAVTNELLRREGVSGLTEKQQRTV